MTRIVSGHDFSCSLAFVHFGLSGKNHLRTALARLRERGDPGEPGWVRDSLILHGRKQPLTPGFAVPAPLGEGCYQLWSRGECKCREGRGFSAPPGTTSSRALIQSLNVTAFCNALNVTKWVQRSMQFPRDTTSDRCYLICGDFSSSSKVAVTTRPTMVRLRALHLSMVSCAVCQ